VSLTLTRTGGSTGEVEAVYTTTAGTAVANTDSDKLVEGQILSGVSVPGANYGDVGDIYLDTKTGRLYGPKTATGWGAGISLIGAPGPEGNANINSYQVSPTNSDWIYDSAWSFETAPQSYTQYFTRYYVITDANITQDILDHGFVDVYINPGPDLDPNQWVPLPYRFLDDSGGFYYFFGYEADVGQIILQYFFEQIAANATLPVLSSYDIPTYAFKVVYGTGTSTAPAGSNAILRPQPAHTPATGERFRVVKP